MDLKNTLEAFCTAVTRADADAVRELSWEHAYHEDLSPEHLVRHAERTGLGLVLATQIDAGERHVAAEAAWYRDTHPTGRTWLMFCETDGLWRFAGRTDSAQVAHAYVYLQADEAPSMDRWAPGDAVKALADSALDRAPSPGDEDGLWAEWLEPVEDAPEIRLGTLAEVPDLNRALIELEWFATDDPDFADTSRSGVFERTEDGWELVSVRYMAVCRSVLDGLSFESEDTVREGLGASGITSPLDGPL